MKTTLYRLRFEEAPASQAAEGRGNLPPDNLHPCETDRFASFFPSTPDADFFPAPISALTASREETGFDPENRAVSQASAPAHTAAPQIITQAEVRKMIDERLEGLRIYVLESDITQAQQAVKSVIELASF